MSNLMEELGQLRAVRERESAEEFEQLLKAAASGDPVDATQAAITLERNGVSLEEFQRRVALKKKRMALAMKVAGRTAAQARVNELQKQIDAANEVMLREYHERHAAITELLREKGAEQIPIDQANAAEAELRESFPGRERLQALRLAMSRGEFTSTAERQKARAEIESLERAELLP